MLFFFGISSILGGVSAASLASSSTFRSGPVEQVAGSLLLAGLVLVGSQIGLMT